MGAASDSDTAERGTAMEKSVDKMAYTIPEAAEALGIGLCSMYNLVHRADFPSFRIGRSVRVSRAKLAEWVEQQAAGGGLRGV